MQMIDYVLVFQSFEKLDIVKRTLPPTIEEVKSSPYNSRIIAIDCSVKDRDMKWEYLKGLESKNREYMDLILASRLPLAMSKNMCLQLVKDKYNPKYLTFCDDDHGLANNGIEILICHIEKYYGKESPNGLLFGLFGCGTHHANTVRHEDGFFYPTLTGMPSGPHGGYGGVNDCFRSAPFSHWLGVLGKYPPDGYQISFYQSKAHNIRNYHKGFTSMNIPNICFHVEHTRSRGSRGDIFDRECSAYDKRANYESGNQMDARVVLTSSCKDCDYIPKVEHAGRVFDKKRPRYQVMHNGLKIKLHCYYGNWMTRIIENLCGHHEPQEEKVFYEILKRVPQGSTMLELGSYWAFYSMWFQKDIPGAKNHMIEPNADRLQTGKDNFALNNMQGTFTQAFLGCKTKCKIAADEAGRIPLVSIDSYLSGNCIDRLEILHSDIQGAEYDMLMGCVESIKTNRVSYFFISTHGDPTHKRCLQFFWNNNISIICEHSPTESYSEDGLIVASTKSSDKDFRVTVSKRRTTMKKTTTVERYYSQYNQDRYLNEMFFKNKRGGIFVDVGATDGITINNTYFFEKELGWKGLCIEPRKAIFGELQKNRHCFLENVCASDVEGESTFLEVLGAKGHLSGLKDKYHPKHLERLEDHRRRGNIPEESEVTVKTVPLNKLLEKYGLFEIDYCSLDTEGNELEILKSIDFSRFKISFFSVENNYGDTLVKEFLESKGYVLIKKLQGDDIFKLERK